MKSLNEQRERDQKVKIGLEIKEQFIQLWALPITQTKSGNNTIITQQNPVQWNYCLLKNSLPRLYGNVLAEKGICRRCLKNMGSRLSVLI